MQRGFYTKGRLSYARISKLESLSFEWDPIEEDWNFKFSELEAYKSKNGNCRVPSVFKPNRQLGNWVFTQRAAYSKGSLSPDRIAKLESLGFEWDPFECRWLMNYEYLARYKMEHGHCKVKKCEAFKELRNWALKQRQEFKKGRLASNRIVKLEEIGFEWNFQ